MTEECKNCGQERDGHIYYIKDEVYCKKFVLREEGRVCAKCGIYKEENKYWKVNGKLRSSCIPCAKKVNKDSFINCKECNKKVNKKSTSHKYCDNCIKKRDLKSNHRWLNVHRKDKDYKFKMASRLKAQRKIRIPEEQLCQKCNKEKAIERHHDDYNKPLEVQFLCKGCHDEVHTRRFKKNE
ncbi:hypothetical protein LCGC14_0538010 [marine sediment metagenome]|uniref:Uncharacterized protein n=1 Tax=marine sediment metagenome TaxID=412755 RepID=A0A0F9V1T0_9ZZZZ